MGSNKMDRVTSKSYLKNIISYFRTYRHLRPNTKAVLLFYLLFMLPCLALLLYFYPTITYYFSWCGSYLLKLIMPGKTIGIAGSNFMPIFGKVHYITLAGTSPSLHQTYINLIVVIVLLVICLNVRKLAKPIMIYGTMALLIHLVSCLFFIIVPQLFPYKLSQYSDLYMKQQVGIWISFLIISCLVSGCINKSGFYKFYVVIGVMAYSVVFGALRYIINLVVLANASSLYMAVLFFIIGPLFDFLYLVCIYGLFLKKITSKFDRELGSGDWQWA